MSVNSNSLCSCGLEICKEVEVEENLNFKVSKNCSELRETFGNYNQTR